MNTFSLLFCRSIGSTAAPTRPQCVVFRPMSGIMVWMLLVLFGMPLSAQESTSGEQTIFSNENPGGASSNPASPAVFMLRQPTTITFVRTYHWNGGNGAPAGSIEILTEQGASLGSWPSVIESRLYHVIRPHIKLQAGTYMIRDSSPTTWSWNLESRHAGFVTVNGVIHGSGSADSGAGSVSRPADRSGRSPASASATATLPEIRNFDRLTFEQRASRLRAGEARPNLPFWELTKIETFSDWLRVTAPDFEELFSGRIYQSNGYILDESNEDWNDEAGVARRTVHKRILRFAFTPSGYLIPGKTVQFVGDISFDMSGTARSTDPQDCPICTGLTSAGASAVIGGKDVFANQDDGGLRHGTGTLHLKGVSEPLPEAVEGEETAIDVSIQGGLGGGWVRYTYRYRTE